MGYHESGESINRSLKLALCDIKSGGLNNENMESLLNTIIKMGQVAKFRCRNNTAYDGFISVCFKDIATVRRVSSEGNDYTTLRVVSEEG